MIGRALEWERIHERREYIVESGMLEEVLNCAGWAVKL